MSPPPPPPWTSPLSTALLPYLAPPHLVPFLFVHPHISTQPLLSLLLPSIIESSARPLHPASSSPPRSPHVNGASSSAARAQAVPPSASTTALVDAIEFGGSTKAFMEDVLRQWGMRQPRKWLGWEHFVAELDEGDQPEGGRLLVVDRVDRLRGPHLGFGPGALASSLAGLGTMVSRAFVTVVFISPSPWDALRPIPSTFADPPIISLPAFTSSETMAYLLAHPPIPSTSPYALHYPAFVSHVYSIASPHHLAPLTLIRLAHALWPVYISPLLPNSNPHQLAQLPTSKEGIALHLATRCRDASQVAIADPCALPGSLDRFRLAGPVDEDERAPVALGSAINGGHVLGVGATSGGEKSRDPLTNLPRMAKFLLIAAFLASYNPPKKDLMYFGRGRWESGGKKKKGGGTRKTTSGRKGTVAKIPQTILGPKPFPLDRLIAIFGSLLAEHDRPDLPSTTMSLANSAANILRDEQWEDEVGEIMASSSIRALVSNLVNLHLLQRTSPADRLEGMMLKSELGWEEAVALGRALKIRLEDWWAGDD